MPNAIDNFQSFYSQYRNAPAAPAQGTTAPAQPGVGNAPAYNPYASGYTPDPRRGTPQPLGTQQPVGAQPQPWNNPNYPQQPGQQLPGQQVPAQTSYPAGYPQPGYPQQAGMPGYQGPLTQTLGAFRGVVNDKGYDEFVQKTAPVIDTAIPLITGIVGLFNKKKPDQPAQNPQTVQTMPGALPGQTPPSPGAVYAPNTQPVYQQPAYPQPGYQQPYPGTPPFSPTGGNDWGAQVNQGIQGVAGLVNAIGGLFK
ncbi:MAG TPA: hypothetical protein V6D05_08810 [Stenomitos sp.]